MQGNDFMQDDVKRSGLKRGKTDNSLPPDTAIKDRLRQVLASYGADPARWPQAERAGLEQIFDVVRTGADDDPAMKKAVMDAHALDHVLAQADAPPPPLGAIGRAMAQVRDAGGNRASGMPAPPVRRWAETMMPGALIAASLILGIALGTSDLTDLVWPEANEFVASLDGESQMPFARPAPIVGGLL